ncbi:EF-hand [Neoconidiobolus thromboides FSU 785]|nr:EF-hand [Neoconidiobolus thromboides FSU 785]
MIPNISSATILTLEELFQQYDQDNDGYISASDLSLTLEQTGASISSEEIEKMIALGDIDNRGKLDKEEFILLFYNLFEKKEESDDNFNLFKLLENGESGFIDAGQLGMVLVALNSELIQGVKEDQLEQSVLELIREVDLDGDSVINYNEFLKIMVV